MKRNQFIQLAIYTTGGAWGAVALNSLLKAQAEQTSSQNPNSTPNLGLKTFSFETVKVNSSGAIITRENKSAEYFTVDLGKGVTMDFVAIPGGSFRMGSLSIEKKREDNEGPRRLVTIKPFFMSKYPVTQAQYEAIMGNNPARFKGAKRPVEQVTWDDSVNFCNKLSQKIGKECLLPSEAQWEYACRAGTTTPFYFGETITSDLANYYGHYTYANEAKGLARSETTEVGIFPPNAFGLSDLHGNVWEWCLDGYGSYYHGKEDGSPLNDKNLKFRITRGGSWSELPCYCRSAKRDLEASNDSEDCVGFRPVCLIGGTYELSPFSPFDLICSFLFRLFNTFYANKY